MKSIKRENKHLPGILLIIGVVLMVGAAVIFGSHKKFEEGQAYLVKLEQRDTEAIKTKLQERDAAEAQAQQDALVAQVNSGTSDVWGLFKNSLLLGDSRVYGFKSYGFLPENRVLAEAGYTIANIPEFVDAAASLQPDVIYFSYGVNDMGLDIGRDQGDNGYRAVYEANIKQLLEKTPQSKVVVNSVIDASAAAVAEHPSWGKTADFNRQIQEMCQDNGWYYADNSTLSNGGNAPIYQADGVHFLSDFYEVWAKNMLKTQIQGLNV